MISLSQLHHKSDPWVSWSLQPG